MNKRTFGMAGLAVAAAIGLGAIVADAQGIRLNFTASAPSGVWQVSQSAALERGALIEVCPPDHPIVDLMVEHHYLDPGSCPGEVTALLKPVAAVAGDTVTIQSGSPAQVNGQPLPNTYANPDMPAWPDGTYEVRDNEIWLFSSYSEKSFDSRYFGPVSTDKVIGVAAPLLIKGDVATMTVMETRP
ncbi:conjugative transfer signal peptidase TraF [Shinella yambaruensis]|uniref:Conjugal transfer protein TraF n=1 Tax=Shinella yambaruensis TaxID=415996 RepID=A0ABQ5ZUX6_9HYPH|nr:conjugative transfer signal peptidase TraF [Shinella yambaruensis]MCJ8029946.1 conjugative transfer signal peptidase TraF [Shinella yambaruensis]MCU7984213.1 conjugative transfer signal peptidase TraF [Shinella yambaruensis]GLR55190.1 conjugal transfer protein TraF [Shinella yambaruensis]